MKNLFISLAIILFSCKENSQTKSIINPQKEDNKPTVSVNMENKLPYTSENVKNYYKLSSDSSSYIVNINNKKLINFTSENTISQIKENDFDIKVTSENQYILLESFNFHDNISSQLIMYNTFGENDSKILITQLNNYKNHKLIDQLMLDCKLTFETQYYRDFSINKNETIDITKYSVDNLEYNENGDIIGEKDNPDVVKEKVLYKINNEGKFIKI